MENSRVQIVENILSANDQIADENQRILDDAGIYSINIMASPGSGKTSLILQTIKALKSKVYIGSVTAELEKIEGVH